MVKLGSNFAEKGTKQVLLEDGFDTIPLMTPLDVNQLQFPPPDKVSVLVVIALAFLTCVVFLVVYKVYKYERLCPDGFVLKNSQCIPNGLAAYYAEQDPHSPDKFYAVVNHYNLAKQSITRSVSPWMSVLSEEKLSEQETEAAEKSA
ncbi:neuronal vesicle trafficking associated 1 [Phyllostomus discolor]|uniref:Neuronal vesicle trafficking-associated protein 1 n=1 Tax=Phyllostomus discolor TaxID=89673 RepID=A0A834BK50_9CHIR|nr:neuronal vesicle trafficking associated 1 [Phyllostomus discolor]